MVDLGAGRMGWVVRKARPAGEGGGDRLYPCRSDRALSSAEMDFLDEAADAKLSEALAATRPIS